MVLRTQHLRLESFIDSTTMFMDTSNSWTSIGSVIPFLPYEDFVYVTEKNKTIKKPAKFQDITMMRQYRNVSQEELRLNDYMMGRNRKVFPLFGNTTLPFGNQTKSMTTGFQFGVPAPPPTTFQFNNPSSVFGNKPTTGIFGQSNTTTSLFGSTANTAPGVFGQQSTTTGLFGQPNTAFGQQTNVFGNTGTGIFGQNKPFGGAGGTNNIFGQPANGFGNTGTNTFGQPNAFGNPGTGIFGQTNAFGTTGTNTFGQPNAFGNTANTFGQSNAFGNTGTGIFGQSNAFGNKGTGIFGQSTNTFGNTGMTALGQPNAFSNTGTGIFGQPAANTGNTLFGKPLQTTGTGFGTGLFGSNTNTSTTGGIFGTPQNNTAKPQFTFNLNPTTTAQAKPSTTSTFSWAGAKPLFGQPNNSGFQTPVTNFGIPQQQQMSPFQPAPFPQPQVTLQNMQPHEMVWRGLGIPIGRYPSIFSPDPDYQSPLFDWVTSPVSGRALYPSGLNPLLASHLIPSNGDASQTPLGKTGSTRSLWKYRPSTSNNSDYIDWNTVVKQNLLRAQQRNNNVISNPVTVDPNPRFRPAYKTFKIDDAFKTSFDPPILDCLDPPCGRKWTRLSPKLVNTMEGWGPNNRYTFSNPGPRIAEQRPILRPTRNTTSQPQQPSRPSHEFQPPPGFYDQTVVERVANYNFPSLRSRQRQPSPPPRRRGPPTTNDDPIEPFLYNSPHAGGASDFEELRGIIQEEPGPSLYGDGRRVRFMEEEMPPPSPRGGGAVTDIQTPIRTNNTGGSGPRPRSQSHTLKLYDGQENFPCRIITLTKPKYYCIPDVSTLHVMASSATGQCLVEDFEIGHPDFGCVVFPGILDVKGLNVDDIVTFKHKEIQIYPDDVKPPYGQELNRLAVVTLKGVWPLDKAKGEMITDVQKIAALGYEDILRQSCNRFRGNFVSYNPTEGLWKFEIQTPPPGYH